MDKFLLQAHTYNKISSIYEALKYCLDLSKLSNDRLKDICEPSNLLLKDIIDALNPTNQDNLEIVLLGQLPNAFMSSLEFEHLSERARRYCLNNLIKNNTTIDIIERLANKMETVNYGNLYYHDDYCNDVYNPLAFCCYNGNLELVKLLVEKHNADIEHLCFNNLTPIMISAMEGHPEVTSYLYHKGAKLTNTVRHIKYMTANTEILNLINEWECKGNVANKQQDNKKTHCTNEQEYIEMKDKYEKLKSELEKIKSTIETMKVMDKL